MFERIDGTTVRHMKEGYTVNFCVEPYYAAYIEGKRAVKIPRSEAYTGELCPRLNFWKVSLGSKRISEEEKGRIIERVNAACEVLNVKASWDFDPPDERRIPMPDGSCTILRTIDGELHEEVIPPEKKGS